MSKYSHHKQLKSFSAKEATSDGLLEVRELGIVELVQVLCTEVVLPLFGGAESWLSS